MRVSMPRLFAAGQHKENYRYTRAMREFFCGIGGAKTKKARRFAELLKKENPAAT